MAAKRMQATSSIETGALTLGQCDASFLINSQPGNQSVASGAQVALLAGDATASSYTWTVTASPPDSEYVLTGADQAEAVLTPKTPGAYTIQLRVAKADCEALARAILWVATLTQQYRLPATNEPLQFDGDAEWAGDLLQVITDVDRALPTPEQKAALGAAHSPNGENAFATLADISGGQVTPEQKAALEAADNPNGQNPFITHSALPPDELTPEQKAALEAAHSPNGENPFITRSALPPDELTPEQKAALEAADNPSGQNPFITRSALPPDELTPEQKAAARGGTRPRKAALEAADNPNGQNPFITHSALPPDELTPEQKAALEAAHSPERRECLRHLG